MTPPLPHDPAKVVVTYMSAGDTDHHFTSLLSDLYRYDWIGEGFDADGKPQGCLHIHHGGEINMMTGPRIAEARNQQVEAFLTTPSLKDCDWLFAIDADMGADGDTLCRLLGHAQAIREKDPRAAIFGGLCFAGGRTRMYPTIYEWDPATVGDGLVPAPRPVTDYPRDAQVKCAATGGAFTLIHRDLLRRMAQPWPQGFGTYPSNPDKRNPNPWYVEGIYEEHQFGEDIALCMRAGGLQYSVYVCTDVKTDHWKRYALNEELWDERRLVNAVAHAPRAERRRAERDLIEFIRNQAKAEL